jgi:hypothetical protein
MLKTPVHYYPHQLQLVNANVAGKGQERNQDGAAFDKQIAHKL